MSFLEFCWQSEKYRILPTFSCYNSVAVISYSVCVSICGQKAEALESGTKQFEELEFCQLEEESSLEERKETQSSQLLQERAEYQCSMAKRKVGIHLSQKTHACVYKIWSCYYMSVWHQETGHIGSQEKMAALEAQVKQLGLQAAHDCERTAKDRTVLLQLLHKVNLS